MIIGVGTDILFIDRIKMLYEKGDATWISFKTKTFTDNEILLAESRPHPYQCYATRFAGKEAVFKSLAIANKQIKLYDIEILEGENGRPYVKLHSNTYKLACENGIDQIELSLSYENEYAIAFATSIANFHG